MPPPLLSADVNQRRKEAAASASLAQRGAEQAAPSTAQQVLQQQEQQQQASVANGLSHMQVQLKLLEAGDGLPASLSVLDATGKAVCQLTAVAQTIPPY